MTARRSCDLCPVRFAFWKGVLFGWVMCLGLALVDVAVTS